ncbi:MAG TPA: aspartate aminotransferase family protein [Candidatus Binatia bacterium]|nr:aspartate aminotransferase family protein [Candidatus Binatia bacterium]HET9883478.1 aspartate aminotransferase family protein [Candidatus Binatia bacterium]
MNNLEIAALTDKYVARTYARIPIALVRGRGTKVWDAEGKEYLDFLAGIAVNSLGHCHPAIVRAIREQSKKLLHVSNLYHVLPQSELARELCNHSFAERVFFCNSGAEANEAAIKLVRRYGLEKLGGKYEILSTHNSFHGRTLATLTATGQEKIRAGYDPLPTGFRQVPYNDLAAIEEAIDEKKTAAILVEPIQAEGGVNVPDEAYMRGLRELCDQRGILLIFDEVQTGMGRTGTLFGYEHFAIKPDIMTLAKALGGGLPLGAMLAREEIATSFGPGSHASTFGGNPVACSAGLVVMQTLLGGALKNCLQMGQYFVKGLEALQKRFSFIREVRGKGLMIGMELEIEGSKVADSCMQEGLLLNCTAYKVLRFVPPLTIKRNEIDRGLDILEKVLARQ